MLDRRTHGISVHVALGAIDFSAHGGGIALTATGDQPNAFWRIYIGDG